MVLIEIFVAYLLIIYINYMLHLLKIFIKIYLHKNI